MRKGVVRSGLVSSFHFHPGTAVPDFHLRLPLRGWSLWRCRSVVPVKLNRAVPQGLKPIHSTCIERSAFHFWIRRRKLENKTGRRLASPGGSAV